MTGWGSWNGQNTKSTQENTVFLCLFLLPSSYWVGGHMPLFAWDSSDYAFCLSIVIINTPFTGIQGRCIMMSLKWQHIGKHVYECQRRIYLTTECLPLGPGNFDVSEVIQFQSGQGKYPVFQSQGQDFVAISCPSLTQKDDNEFSGRERDKVLFFPCHHPIG